MWKEIDIRDINDRNNAWKGRRPFKLYACFDWISSFKDKVKNMEEAKQS